MEKSALDKYELVLYYGLNDTQAEILETILSRIGVDCRRVQDCQYNWTIHSLLDGKKLPRTGCDGDLPVPAESVAVLNALSDQKINEFLTAVREAEGLSIDLKAVVTEHNLNWKLSDLIIELRQENALMKIYMAVKSQIRTIRLWLSDENLINNQTASVIQWRRELEQQTDAAQAYLTACEQSQEMDPELLEKYKSRLASLMNVSFDDRSE